MSTLIKGIIFDLDGTLIDSRLDIRAAIEAVFAKKLPDGKNTLHKPEDLSLSPHDMLANLLKSEGKQASEQQIKELYRTFIHSYHQAPSKHTRFFPTVEKDVKMLHSKGYQLGICTNKVQSLSEKILEDLGLKDYFETILGADKVSSPKPCADHLLSAVNNMGLDPQQVLYVGDTLVDKQCAINAGIFWYIVDWSDDPALGLAQSRRIKRLLDLEHIAQKLNERKQ